MDLPARVRKAVERVVRALDGTEINWAFTGSVAHRLHGADVEVHDIDVQTDAPGAYEVARRLQQWIIEPVHFRRSGTVRSHYGRFRFDDLDIDLEVMGGMDKRKPDDSWTGPTDPADHAVYVNLGKEQVPVLSLRYEAEAYELLGRAERAELLRRLTRRSLIELRVGKIESQSSPASSTASTRVWAMGAPTSSRVGR